ncbi:MAG TPA: type II CAAX endopeptidase family protein, partial [Deltaproteobacteria bacterium]|nr:type II CAAX endopeptidase family protein [Deltaproteobacteria bacterium]
FSSRQEQTIEVAVFLFLIIPSMILSFFAREEGDIGFIITAWAIITRDLALMSLVLFFLWRNAEPITSIGWRWTNVWHEVLIGLALFPVFFVLLGIVGALLQGIGFNVPTASQPQFLIVKGIPEMLLAFLLVVVVAVVEETIFRGYLLLRFLHITQSKTWSVLVSAVVFSLGHGYEGSAGVGTVGIMGAVFAVIYLWRGSIVAPVIIHFLQDFIGILVAPFLSGQ